MFPRLESFRRVMDWLERNVRVLPAEEIPLAESHRRRLAAGCRAPCDLPSQEVAAVDGYALRAAETSGLDSYHPDFLSLLGTATPWNPFPGELAPRSAVRVTEGTPLPRGADAVAPLILGEEQGKGVNVYGQVVAGENVRRRGADVREGGLLLEAGAHLRPQDLAIMAGCGLQRVRVVAQPRVRIVILGGGAAGLAAPSGGFEAISVLLRACVERSSGKVTEVVRLAEDREAIRGHLKAPGADVILLVRSGSQGGKDLAAEALAECGELAMLGIALEPARSSGLGRVRESLVFLLPGDLVSGLCAYDCLVAPALDRLGGGEWGRFRRRTEGVLRRKISSSLGLVEQVWVRVGEAGIEPLATGSAGRLGMLLAADGYALVPEECEGHAAGTRLSVFLYE
ncbi:MAG TPA: molybdopterin molybdotransferase MoeA [Methylococcus sp.]|nr:molybdopterin molybdotransferase MoeA [Methylococcus sp.]